MVAGQAAMAASAALRVEDAHTQGITAHISGAFRVTESSRCTGHYQVAGEGATTAANCGTICGEDARCSSFSFEIIGGNKCFLYSRDAECQAEPGWSTGHKVDECGIASQDSGTVVRCPYGMVISEVTFASYGTASGDCHNFELGSCHEDTSKEVIEDLCLGENECSLSASSQVFGEPCGIVDKNLRVEVECAVGQSFYEDVYFNAWSNRHWSTALSEVESRRDEWKGFLEALPEYPNAKFSGRGIIIVAGGHYLEPAVVTINMIRKMTSSLRIQVWHLGDEEMTSAHRKVLEPYNVETRDFKDYVGEEMLQPIQANVGMRLFQLKPLAMLHSDLEDILLLDSDNCPVRDPTFLFDSAEFKETGSLFWPDYWRTSLENPIWKIVGRSPVSEWEQESGQMVIHKASAWKAMNLAVHFNSAFYMKLLNGDKDTFRFSWVAADVPYTMVQTLPTPIGTLKELYSEDKGFCSHTMLQHDLSGEPLFVHHNQIKNTALAAGENFKYQKLTGDATTIRAVPVAALHIATGSAAGSMISCIDLQCIGGECDASESGLGQFEADYFAAQASIPAGAFTNEKHAAPPIINAEGYHVSEKRQAQLKLQQVVANRLRRDTNTTCTSTEFELVKPTLNNDRVCEPVTVCASQSVSPTATSDRVCAASAPRTAKTFVVSVGAKTAAHPYYKFGADKSIHINAEEAPEIRVTRLENYEFVFDENKEHPFMLTLDAIGGTNSNAYTEGVHGSAAGGDKTISFSPSPHTPSLLYYQSQASTHMGWRVHVSDPTFTAAHTGSHKRFATAFSPAATLFEETGVAGTYESVRQACEKRCAISAACRGVHIYRAVKTVTCAGLNDVGGDAQATKLDSESILKVVF